MVCVIKSEEKFRMTQFCTSFDESYDIKLNRKKKQQETTTKCSIKTQIGFSFS